MTNKNDKYLEIKEIEQLGKTIRRRRKNLGVRIDEAALMIGISKETLSKIENGSPGTSIGKILKTAKELGIKIFVENE